MKIFFITILSAIIIILFVHAIAVSSSSAATTNPKKQNRKPSSSSTSTSPKKYRELYDLFNDLAQRMCNKLGPLIQESQRRHTNRKFNWRTRCDLFYETLETTAVALGDTMVHELDLTQQQLLDSAMTPQNYFGIVTAIKKGVKETLTNPEARIKEKDLSLSVHQLFSQVILSAATQDPGTYQEMKRLPRDAARNAQEAGIRMPSYGLMDLDELDEETFLTGEDLQWAQTTKANVIEEVEQEQQQQEGDDDDDENLVDSENKRRRGEVKKDDELELDPEEKVKRNLRRAEKEVEKLKKNHHQRKRGGKNGNSNDDDQEEDDDDDDSSEEMLDRAEDEADEKLIDELSKEDWLTKSH